MKSFSDPMTHFRISRSESPVSEDGYKIGEPKWLECETCEARVLLTRDPSPGIDELQHQPTCPQRWVRSKWWRLNFMQDE